MPDPLILSASSVQTYLDCGYKYLLSSVFRLPGRPSMAAAIGIAVHAGVEFSHKDPNDSGFIEALTTAFDAEVAKMIPPYDEPDPNIARRDAMLMLGVYRSTVMPRFKPTLIEHSFVVNIDGINVSGQIDAADEDVHDTKTRAGKTINGRKPSAFKGERHRFQLSVYGLALRFLRGRYPRRLIIDSLTRRGTYTEYVIEPAYAEVPDLLGLTRDGIMDERFEPTGPANGSCLYCPYYARECSFGSID